MEVCIEELRVAQSVILRQSKLAEIKNVWSLTSTALRKIITLGVITI
jgi:hypothetical protein